MSHTPMSVRRTVLNNSNYTKNDLRNGLRSLLREQIYESGTTEFKESYPYADYSEQRLTGAYYLAETNVYAYDPGRKLGVRATLESWRNNPLALSSGITNRKIRHY